MPLQPLNYHHVDLLYHVVRLRSVTAAAKYLHVSQPAISKQLHILESDLNIRLFDRLKGRLIPTPEASLLFDQIERTRASLRSLNELADGLRSGSQGRLTICANPAITEKVLPEAIAKFQREFQNVSVELTIENDEKMLDLVETQQVDLAVCAPFRQMRNVLQRPLFDSRIMCAVWHEDEIAQLLEVELTRIATAPMILVGALTETVDQLINMSTNADFNKNVRARVSSSAVACKLAASTGFRAIVDSLTIDSLEMESLAYIPIKSIPPRKIAVLQPALRVASYFVEPFTRILEAEVVEQLRRKH